MRMLAGVLALLLAFPAPGWTAEAAVDASTSAATVLETAPIVVTAPAPETERALKTVRAAGVGTGVAGVGLMTYVAVAGLSGPFGWAAALIFLGGMTAYLSNRRLQGHDDFTWGAPKPVSNPAPKAETAPRR